MTRPCTPTTRSLAVVLVHTRLTSPPRRSLPESKVHLSQQHAAALAPRLTPGEPLWPRRRPPSRSQPMSRMCSWRVLVCVVATVCTSLAAGHASLSANSLPAYIWRSWWPDHRDHSLARLLTFMTRIAAEWYSTATQHWRNRSLHGPTGFALPLRTVDAIYSLSEIRTRGGLARRETYPSVDLRSGDSLFGARETASSPEDHGRRKHVGEIKNSHNGEARDHWERAARSVEEHDQTTALGPLLQRITGVVLHAWFDSLPRSRHHHPLSWDHASGPETGFVFFSRLARWSRCWDLRMLSCGMVLITEQDRIWWKESSRTTPHLTQLSSSGTWASLATGAFDQQAAVAPVSSAPHMARSSLFLEKTQMLRNDGNVATLLQTRPIPVGGGTGPTHRQDVPREDLNQFSRVTHTRERPVDTFTMSLPTSSLFAQFFRPSFCAAPTVQSEQVETRWDDGIEIEAAARPVGNFQLCIGDRHKLLHSNLFFCALCL